MHPFGDRTAYTWNSKLEFKNGEDLHESRVSILSKPVVVVVIVVPAVFTALLKNSQKAQELQSHKRNNTHTLSLEKKKNL